LIDSTEDVEDRIKNIQGEGYPLSQKGKGQEKSLAEAVWASKTTSDG